MKADTMNIELPSQAGTVLTILKAILNDSGEHQTEAVKRALSAYGEACFEAGRSRAASEPGEVARLAEACKREARHLFDLAPGAEDMAHLSMAIDRLASMVTSPASEAGEVESLVDELGSLVAEMLELADNWPGIRYSEELASRAKSALARMATSPPSEAQAGALHPSWYAQPASSPVAAEGQKAVERRANQSLEGTASELWRIGLLEWGVAGWRDEVQNRPLVNIHRERLDNFWRTVIRKAGGDPDALVGPAEPALATPTASMADAAEAAKCACGDRLASECDEQWGPNCDMGNNAAHVRVSTVDPAVIDAALATPGPRGENAGGVVEAFTDAAREVLGERSRQVSVEGWTPEHDDEHREGEMCYAAAGYACAASDALQAIEHEMDGHGEPTLDDDATLLHDRPWPHGWTFKPAPPRRQLIKAGALILAEIERIDRGLRIAEKGEESE